MSLIKKFSNFTGDVAFRILEAVNSVSRRAIQDMLENNLHEDTQIYVCDINPNMLNVGKKRAQERGNCTRSEPDDKGPFDKIIG